MLKIIEAKDLELSYQKNEQIIKKANFSVNENDFIFITGASGSGKSTLLKSLHGSIDIKNGNLKVCDVNMNNPSKNDILNLRKNIGIIFQDFKLIKEWNIQKNVMLPMIIKGYKKEVCLQQSQRLLTHIKLAHKASKYPLELSGGEQQRVALARALAHNPIIILADEPTGNLDDYSSELVWHLLRSANLQLKITIIVVTHKIPEQNNISYRRLHIEDGVVYELN